MKASSRLAIVAAIAMSAAAAQAAGTDFTDGNYPPQEQARSTLTRAQVLAELKAAQERGEVGSLEEVYRFPKTEVTRSDVSREQVRQETMAAGHAGLLDNFGG